MDHAHQLARLLWSFITKYQTNCIAFQLYNLKSHLNVTLKFNWRALSSKIFPCTMANVHFCISRQAIHTKFDVLIFHAINFDLMIINDGFSSSRTLLSYLLIFLKNFKRWTVMLNIIHHISNMQRHIFIYFHI